MTVMLDARLRKNLDYWLLIFALGIVSIGIVERNPWKRLNNTCSPVRGDPAPGSPLTGLRWLADL